MVNIQFLATTTILSAFAFLLASCDSPGITATPLLSTPIPFLTSTRMSSSATTTGQTLEGLVTAEAPLPTPTPFLYTIQQGDTMSSVALKFGVSIDELQTANPELSPNAMSVGQVIHIPSNPQNPSGEPTPTPAAFTIEQIECYPTADQGMWCFVLAHNEFSDFMENVSAQITLVDENNTVLATQTALLPLNILPPNTSLPLTAFFPPEISPDAKPQVQVLTSIRLLPDDKRYLPATINNTLVQVYADGRSARVKGQVILPAYAETARQTWVIGTAYDETARVVGMRRWESSASLSPGATLSFEFLVSSLGGTIERVEFAVEARP